MNTSPTASAIWSWGMCALCVLLTLGVHWFSYLNPDSAWLLTVAERWVGGDRLYVDISETNPPLVVWLHAIPVWFSQIAPVSLAQAFIIVITIFCALSYLACRYVNRTYPLLNIMAVAVMTLVATHQFGQREHLLIIFALPFFLSALPGNRLSILAATFAAIGLLLKPHFLLLWGVVVLAGLADFKHIKIRWLISNALIGLIGVGYAAYLFWLDTTYWDTTAQFLLEYYHSFLAPPEPLYTKLAILGALLLGPYVLSLMVAKSQPRAIHFLAALAMVAWVIVWLQGKGWSNHWYPFFAFGLLLNGALIAELKSRSERFWCKLNMSLAALACVAMAFFSASVIYNMLNHTWPKQVQEQVTLLKDQQAKTIGTFSFDLMALSPAQLHTQTTFDGVYGHLWFLSGLYWHAINSETNEPYYRSVGEMSDVEKQFFKQVVQGFVLQPPDVVVVSEREDYYHPDYGSYGFDFIRYYSQHSDFSITWDHYKPVAKIGNQRYYRFHD